MDSHRNDQSARPALARPNVARPEKYALWVAVTVMIPWFVASCGPAQNVGSALSSTLNGVTDNLFVPTNGQNMSIPERTEEPVEQKSVKRGGTAKNKSKSVPRTESEAPPQKGKTTPRETNPQGGADGLTGADRPTGL